MRRFKSFNHVEVQAINGEPSQGAILEEIPEIMISGHEVEEDLMIMEVSGTSYTLSIDEVKRAIDNVQNTSFE